jgi:hypothetical protein
LKVKQLKELEQGNLWVRKAMRRVGWSRSAAPLMLCQLRYAAYPEPVIPLPAQLLLFRAHLGRPRPVRRFPKANPCR